MKYYFKIKNVDSTTYQQVKNISAALSTAQNTLPASFVLTFFTLLFSSEKFVLIIQRELAKPVEFLNEMQRVVALRLSWVSGIISVSKLPGVVSGRYIDPQLGGAWLTAAPRGRRRYCLHDSPMTRRNVASACIN